MTSLVANGVGLDGRLAPTDLTVSSGEMVALIGPNGGGKTSLLRALARVEHATGQVTVDGEDLDQLPEPRRRRLIALLPASREVGWPIPVRDVIELGLGRPDDHRIRELLAQFELDGLADRPINQLSTGERARVLTARALAARPRLLLLDEPLSNLEPYWVLRLVEVLRDVADQGAAVLVALHDLGQLALFDRALLMASGSLEMDAAPASLLASDRFENIFRVTLAGDTWRLKS